MDELPTWIAPAVVIAIILLAISGSGIAVLNRIERAATTPPSPTAAPSPTSADVPTATPRPPNLLDVGQRIEDIITPGLPTRDYTIATQAGSLIAADVWPAPGSPVELRISLSDPNGFEVDYSAHPTITSVQATVPRDGLYTLRVEGVGYGPFSLRVREATADSIPLAQATDRTAWRIAEEQPLDIGQSVSRQFEAPYDSHTYVVDGLPNQAARATLEGEALLLVSDFTTGEESIAPHGVIETGGTNLRLRVVPFGGRDYTLTTTFIEDDFRVWRGRLVPGRTNTGQFDLDNQRDEWAFYGLAGQQITLSVGVFGTTHTVMGPAGQVLPSDFPSPPDEDIGVYSLPEDGIYRLVVEPTARPGNYRVEVRTAPEEQYTDRPAELPFGVSVFATLYPSEPTHTYDLDVVAGQRYAISGRGITPETWIWLEVLNEDGQTIAATREQFTLNEERAVFTAEATARYSVRVIPAPPRPIMTYTLRAEVADRFEPAAHYANSYSRVYEGNLSVGETETGTFERADHAHDYTVPPTTDPYTIVLESSPTMQLCPILMQSRSFCGNFGMGFTLRPGLSQAAVLPHAQPQTVRIVPLFGSTGDYTIRLEEGWRPFPIPDDAQPLTPDSPYVEGETFVVEGQPGTPLLVDIQPRQAYQVDGRDPLGFDLPLRREDGWLWMEFREDGPHLLRVTPLAQTIAAINTPPQVALIDISDPPPDKGQLAVEEATTATLVGLQPDGWSLVTPLNQTVTVQLESARPTIEMAIYDSSGMLVDAARGPNPRITLAPPTDAFHRVEVTHTALDERGYFPPPTIDYRLAVLPDQGLSPGETRTFTGSDEGYISAPYEADRWLVDTRTTPRITLSSAAYSIMITDAEGNPLTVVRAVPADKGGRRFSLPSYSELVSVWVYRTDGGHGYYTISK